MTGLFLDRFWANVAVRGPDECWPWTGARIATGYGIVSTRRPNHDGAHRIAWVLHTLEPIPPRMVVAHRCDNPPCVNPAHLFLTTQRGNLLDMEAKGRSKHVGPRYRVLVTIGGATRNLNAWALLNGISRQTVNARLRSGWTPVDAVSIPAGRYRRSA